MPYSSMDFRKSLRGLGFTKGEEGGGKGIHVFLSY